MLPLRRCCCSFSFSRFVRNTELCCSLVRKRRASLAICPVLNLVRALRRAASSSRPSLLFFRAAYSFASVDTQAFPAHTLRSLLGLLSCYARFNPIAGIFPASHEQGGPLQDHTHSTEGFVALDIPHDKAILQECPWPPCLQTPELPLKTLPTTSQQQWNQGQDASSRRCLAPSSS